MSIPAGLSTKERLEKLRAALGRSNDNEFSGLTGKTLRTLIDSGVVTLAPSCVDPFTVVFDYDTPELFKEVDDHKALAFMEANPRATASGFFNEESATIVIDSIIVGLRKVVDEKFQSSLVAIPGSPALTKKQIVDFANVFHKADEFKIGEDFAYAWFD